MQRGRWAGRSGFLSTLSQDGTFSGTVPGGGSFLYTCRSASYTAGPGEIAIIWSWASVDAPSGYSLGVRAGYDNGSGDQTLGYNGIDWNNTGAYGWLNNSQTGVLPLTAGASYTFSTAVHSDLGGSYGVGSTCYCHTLVVIAKATSVAAASPINAPQLAPAVRR